MGKSRRDLLAASVATFTTMGLAGCGAGADDAASPPSESATPTDTPETTDEGETERSEGTDGDGSPSQGGSVDAAVAAEWNGMRARLFDALALGRAGELGDGARVARTTFERFEGASGEYGAHEALERTSETNYAEFEEALGELRTAGLAADDVGRASEEADVASTQLAEAQSTLVGDPTAQVLDLQLLGARSQDAAFLADAGSHEAAGTVADAVLERFESAPVHDALESADPEAYERFETAVDAIATAADRGEADEVRSRAREALSAAVDGSYALAVDPVTAGVGHLATLQARGFDAAALAGMGGPPTAYAHAVTLTVYRARVHDAQWLAARGATDRAATMVGDVFAHFEGARAHEALESADHEAYEGFEAGLGSLETAVGNGDPAAIDDAVSTVDENLVAGVEALAGPDAPSLEAAFFRARFADARELYRMGANGAAATVGERLFERFEADELGLHEAVESTSEDLYHRFEEEHLAGLVDAFGNAADDAVDTHYEGVQSALLEYATTAGTTATASGAEAAYLDARGFDAAALDALGNDGRARSIARSAFEHFEAGAGGYHEALEEADESLYETFERRLGAVATAAKEDEDVYSASRAFDAEALRSAYAVVGSAGGSHRDAATAVLEGVFADFESARVHEMLEDADHNAYETFEAELEGYATALEDGGDATAAAASFARAAQYARFALVDAVEDVPLDLDLAGTGGGHSGGSDGGSGLSGGPNVVDGVPGDADHVIDATAVAFEPADITVSKGDTVAWKHAAGEPHSVTAYEAKLPDGADYWASGDFDSESAARKGWEDGTGAVQSGQSYVHTFETTGTHEYFCIPHETAGMTGSVTVE